MKSNMLTALYCQNCQQRVICELPIYTYSIIFYPPSFPLNNARNLLVKILHSFKSLDLPQQMIHENSDLPITCFCMYLWGNSSWHESRQQEKVLDIRCRFKQDSVHYLCVISNLGIQERHQICRLSNDSPQFRCTTQY